MDWEKILNQALDYIETNLLTIASVNAVAGQVHVSSYYFQKAFSLFCGYSVMEYIRNRRLYLAGLDILKQNERIIDIALRYGYDTPESFTKAFRRFYGVSPRELRQDPSSLKSFLPIRIQVAIQGGDQLAVQIVTKPAFRIMGLMKSFAYEEAFAQIPAFWQTAYDPKRMPTIGKYGINIDDPEMDDRFIYVIAGDYDPVSASDYVSYEIPSFTWAIFSCTGPMPGSLQALNRRIFKEWLPDNNGYVIAGGYNIELYAMGDIQAADYHSEIWIPVKPI